MRRKVCNALKHMGILLDETRNISYSENAVISAEDSPVTIHVIPANEELGVARKTFSYVK